MKTFKVILLAGIFIVALFIALLYIALRTKITVVSHEAPYAQHIGKRLTIEQDALLVKNVESFVQEKPFMLVDSEERLFNSITEKHPVTVGTELIIDEAKLFKNGTSGFTTSVVIGRLITASGEREFEYVWGDEHASLSTEKPNEWTFPVPLWSTLNHDSDRRYIFNN